MAPPTQQVKNQQGQAKKIVLNRPCHRFEIANSLKFGGREVRHANTANMHLLRALDLIRVGIDQEHLGITSDKHVVLVNIADDNARLMSDIKHRSRVPSNVQQKVPAHLRMGLLTFCGAINRVNGFGVRQPTHGEPDYRTARLVVQSAHRPSRVLG